MDEKWAPERDVYLLRDILDLARPDGRAADDSGSALLDGLSRLLGCVATLRAVHAAQLPAGSGGEPSSDVRELAVREDLDEAGSRVELVLRREGGQPFGEGEKLLLDLLAPHLAAWLSAGSRRPEPADLHLLTGRQLEILHLVQLGMSNKEIARGLGISEATVRKHLENVFERLGVPSRTAAVSTALSVTVAG